MSAINEARGTGSGSLNLLSDVALSNLQNGQGIIYDSIEEKWKNATLGGSEEVSTTPEWSMFPHRTNPAVDTHNSYSVNNAMELGTASTLRHNLMLENTGDTSGVFIATWTESTGSKDYADSSGQTSVYAQLWQDKWNTRRTDITATIGTSAIVDVFPIGDTVYDENGNALCTIIAASDSTVKTRSNGQIFIGIIYGSDGKSHIVYRTATISSLSISLDNSINVLLINGAEWNMTTLREDYLQATSQLNTYIIYRSNYYYMAVVQNGVGVAIMKSSDCIDWSLQAHIPDTDAHLEACICVTAYTSNNLPTVFVAVRHPYGDGYLSLHCYNNLNFDTEITKVYIPASSGRPMMVSDSNAKRAFLCFSTNGRRNAVIVRIGSNNDGTTAYELMTTPLDTMSNYPCIAMNNKLLLFGGTNGLGSSKLGVSVAPLWTEELTNYDNYEENLLSAVTNGVPAFTSADAGKFLTINSDGTIIATDLSVWTGGSY